MKSSTPQRTLGWLLLTTWMACCVGLLSCRKSPDRKVIVRGKVIEYGTGEPVADARIYVLCYDGPIFGSPSSSLADSILTDADGRFYREYEDSELCNGVYLIPYKEGYFKGGEIDLTTNNEEHEVVLDPEAWLKIRCIANSSQSSLHFQVLNYSKDISSHISMDTTFRYLGGVSLFGGREERIAWRTYPNQTYYQDTLYLTPHDTTIYTIHY